MDKIKIAAGGWVVVCDGAKALIFTNAGDAKFPNLKIHEVYEQETAKNHEMGTDAPGRTFNSTDSRRSAVEQTDWHDKQEREFLTGLVTRLKTAVDQGQVESMVVVGAPRALGMLRQAYANIHVLKTAIRDEIAKDYAGLPAYEIEKRLLG